MFKRQKWTEREDKALRKIINRLDDGKKDSNMKWDLIAKNLSQINFSKTAKQCRER